MADQFLTRAKQITNGDVFIEDRMTPDSSTEALNEPTSSERVPSPESSGTDSGISSSTSLSTLKMEEEAKGKSGKRKFSMIGDNLIAHIELGVHPPMGPHRIPFSFNQAQRVAKPVENPEKWQGKTNENPLELDLEMVADEYMGEIRKIQVGPAFQIDVSKIPFYDLKNGDPYGSDSDDEEEIMMPLDIKFQETPEEVFKIIQKQYWTPIFLQFKGQIPYEIALEHLKKCELNIEIALDTIDQKLKNVKQELKPLCAAQALKLGKLVKDERNSVQKIQHQTLRNYHLGEVGDFHRIFERLYIHQPKDVACTCHSMPYLETPFEPRVSCSNCNRNHRNPTANSHRLRDREDQKSWCLICQVYFEITKRRRPAENVIFSESDIAFLQTWNQREEEQRKKLTRKQVEDQIQEELTQRWKRLELTAEEKDMIHHELQEEEQISGEKVAAMLQPFYTPHFTKCQCSKSGGVTRHSKNFGKWKWTAEEQKTWRELIVKMKGNVEKVAKVLKVEPGLVERFKKVFSKRHFHLKPRLTKPHLDLPTPLPTDNNFGLGQPSTSGRRQQRKPKRGKFSK